MQSRSSGLPLLLRCSEQQEPAKYADHQAEDDYPEDGYSAIVRAVGVGTRRPADLKVVSKFDPVWTRGSASRLVVCPKRRYRRIGKVGIISRAPARDVVPKALARWCHVEFPLGVSRYRVNPPYRLSVPSLT